MDIRRTDDYALIRKMETFKKNKMYKKSWIQIKKSHPCMCNKVKLVTAHFLIQKRKKKRLFHSLNSFLFFDRNPWACMIYEQMWLILVYHLNESWKIFGDICFAQVKFPDFSMTFFKWHKIPWLFQVSRNSRFAGHPEMSNMCTSIYLYPPWQKPRDTAT